MRLSLKRFVKKFLREKERKSFFKNQKNTFNLSKAKVKKANKLGFTADEYVIYNLDKNDHREYLSEWDRYLFREQLGAKKIIFDNKLLCTTTLSKFASVNTIFAYKIHNSDLIVLEKATYDGIISTLKRLNKIVYKKILLGGGEGFKLFSYCDGKFYINRQECTDSNIVELIENSDDFLLEEYCYQNEFENNIFPYSVNTIRIITVAHKSGELEPILGIGADADKCVDNACAGGLYAEIDIETGKLSSARSHSKNMINKEFSKHPTTGSQIEGLTVPNWNSIIEKTIELHHKLTFTELKFIAWDIALVEKGVKIIEANPSCSMDFAQTFSSQKNGKIGAWMKEWGYIK